MNKQIQIAYQELDHISQLSEVHQQLLNTARQYTENAYAPYSNFFVAASVLLSSGEIVSGTNQENASFPVGMCAERSVLATIANLYSTAKIDTMAISYRNNNVDDNAVPCAPCGMCRQAMLEWELRQQQPLQLILGGQSGAILVFASAQTLLPFSFAGFAR
jgi:cytidine deaminase